MQEAEQQKAEQQAIEKQEKERRKKRRISEEEYRALQEKASEFASLYDRYLRLQAEFENTRKRHLKEKEEYIRFAHGAMVQELLPVYDHFVLALSNLQGSSEEGNPHALLQGVQMIRDEMWDLLARNGLSKIETVGKPFDPEIHEAIATVEDDNYPEETVIEEIRPGYLLHERLLRPASVKITRKKTEGPRVQGAEGPTEVYGPDTPESPNPEP